MKEPLKLASWESGAALPACMLQALYVLGCIGEEELIEVNAAFGRESKQPDRNMGTLSTALQRGVSVRTISPYDPEEIAYGKNPASYIYQTLQTLGENPAHMDHSRLSDDVRQAAARIVALQAAFPKQCSRELRTATLEDIKQQLDLDRVVLVSVRQTSGPELVLPHSTDECRLYRPEFGATVPISFEQLWKSIVPAISAFSAGAPHNQ